MIAFVRITGLPTTILERTSDMMEKEAELRKKLEEFVKKVKADPSNKGEASRAIKKVDYFPVYYQKDSRVVWDYAFVNVEVYVASCIITTSTYWSSQLTLALREFFSAHFSSIRTVRYEVIEAKFVDNGMIDVGKC